MAYDKKIIVGDRSSLLSICQTKEVISLLETRFPQNSFELKTISTLGDREKQWARDSKGIFVKEIEEALLTGYIDFAVHSLKDVPVDIPDDLKLASIVQRKDFRDVLVTRTKTELLDLKKHSLIGTSSLRRSSQLFNLRPDFKVNPLRGNLDTRIKKLKNGEFDAIVVAATGLSRLRKSISESNDLFSGVFLDYISSEHILPAPGQGALGIEIRKNDKRIDKIISTLNDENTSISVKAERAFLKTLGGGCRVPIAALAYIIDNKLVLEGLVISLEGRRVVRYIKEGVVEQACKLGENLAKKILKNGGAEILKEINEEIR